MRAGYRCIARSIIQSPLLLKHAKRPEKYFSGLFICLRYFRDVSYPAIITIGQMLMALESGKYDLQNTSVLLTQTGGGCRAKIYIP